MSAMAIRHPSRPNTLAWPSPAPDAPPVMNAVRPLNSNGMVFLQHNFGNIAHMRDGNFCVGPGNRRRDAIASWQIARE
jgi:hypothetical protein